MRRGMLVVGLVGLVGLIGCAGGHEHGIEEPEDEPRSMQRADADGTRVASNVASAQPPRSEVTPKAVRARQAEAPFDPRFVDPLRAVLASYEAWGRVDDEARWAPWLCRMPRSATARVSESGDPQTHGQKLYTLYAMDPEAYGAPPSDMVPDGGAAIEGLRQVIVKEAFAPEPFDPSGHAMHLGVGVGAHGLQPTQRDGQWFMAGERRGLYVMMQVDDGAESGDAPEDTDAGWVYATVDRDMVTVTGLGMIESCAGCHGEAGDDRLFGLPDALDPLDPARSHDGGRDHAAPRNANAIRAR